jgi:hypothetical protein
MSIVKGVQPSTKRGQAIRNTVAVAQNSKQSKTREAGFRKSGLGPKNQNFFRQSTINAGQGDQDIQIHIIDNFAKMPPNMKYS